MASSVLTTSAMQRLQKDFREMEKEPLPGIRVEFDANNPALMCLLLTPQEGPYVGLCLHLSVCIPHIYPLHPPIVSIQTPVQHPNVFGSYICCDLLQISRDRNVTSYAGGYTPAYLLKYLFLQLLSFFSTPRIEQDHGGFRRLDTYTVGLTSSLCENFSCNKCEFNSIQSRGRHIDAQGASWSNDGRTSTTKQSTSKGTRKHGKKCMEKQNTSESKQRCIEKLSQVHLVDREDHLDMLHDHVWLLIFDHLSDQDLINLGKASPRRAGDVLRRYNVSLRRELLCFFTRNTFKAAVLGVGVRLDRALQNRKTALFVDAFDLLSLEAFQEQGVRDGICGHKFTHFLPLALDDDHFTRAIPSLRKFLTDVQLTSDMSPTGFLYVIPKLMNSMIVNMMKVCDEHLGNTCEDKRTILQASEKAFKGYCLLFHLLVKFSTRFPVIKDKAEEKLALFLSSKQACNKTSIPDLGEFVAMLPLALKEGYNWGSLCSALVEELLTRNVLWVLRAKPELEDFRISLVPRQRRFEETFIASRTGLRLMMLQANFMRALAHSRNKLSETYGFPSDAMATKLVDLVKKIYLVGEGRDPYQKGYGAWKDFFTILHYTPLPDEFETERMLRRAIQDSKRKGYHR